MSCGHCAAAVERTLKNEVPGVSDAVVNLSRAVVAVEYDDSRATLQQMAAAVESAGYRLVLTPVKDAG
jgi:copper chaperone CopZ